LRFKYIFFDLDGTLTDPIEGIANSVSYALIKMGVKQEDIHSLGRFIGPPLVYSFKEYYGMTPEEADRAVNFYRETYSVKGVYENKLYPGITELLEKLTGEGRKVFMATSKPTKFATIVAEHFNISRFFSRIEGASMNHSDVQKSFMINNIIEEFGIPDKSECIMLGDRHYDIEGAKGCNISGIGCTYGYGTREELEKAGADYLVNDVYEIINLFNKI